MMTKVLATYYLTIQEIPDTEFKVEILEDGPIKKVTVNDTLYDVNYNVGGDTIYSIIMNNRSYGVQISNKGDTYDIMHKGDSFKVQVIDELKKMRLARTKSSISGRQVLTAQMPGAIQKVYVGPGDMVKAGTPLCILTAMKMENEICSPIDGTVKEVFVSENDKIAVGDKMMIVE